jgi:predicted porin
MGLAQSSVTLFGIADVTARRVSNSGATSVTQLASGGLNTSRFGLRGTEDLGGGYSAGFWLEGALLIDSGTGGGSNTNNQASGATPAGGLTFGRRSSVSLYAPWGELRIGRDLVPQILTTTYYDPFFNVGVGASQTFNSLITGPTGVRASNSISLLTRPGPGFIGHLMYYMGENASGSANSKDGTGVGIRLGYAFDTLEVTASTSDTKYVGANTRQTTVGAIWNFGAGKLTGVVNDDRSGALKARGFNVGVIVPLRQHEFKAAYSQYKIDNNLLSPMAKKISLGYAYNLSKRTALYTAVGYVKNSNGATATAAPGAPAARANGNSTGLDLGVRHMF